MAHLKGLAILYLRKKQFAVKSLLPEPQKDKKVDPREPVQQHKVGLGLVKKLTEGGLKDPKKISERSKNIQGNPF